MRHVMLDLETWGLNPGSALRSIGAVEFELDGRTGETFYANLDTQSCLAAGLRQDPGTVAWWDKQPAAAQAALFADQRPLSDVVGEFHGWFGARGASTVWAQGAAFDPVLWECAAGRVRMRVPWKFWNVRDTRTVYEVFSFDPRSLTRRGHHHNALDDAVFQVACVAAALRNGLVPWPGEDVFA